MYIIPAIDLIKGKCVRLIQGEYHRQITYEQNPVKQAELFHAQGAKWLHIVDLEGAKIGKPVNTDVIASIAKLGKLNIEVGGGLRDEDAIKNLLDIGVNRIIIGTKAVGDFLWFTEITKKFQGKIALAIDARGSKVATRAWTQETPQNLIEFAIKADLLPLAAIIYTDISKDGMMAGPNLERTKILAQTISTPLIASGGIKSIADVEALKKLNIEAAIIGRALYEKTMNLNEAVIAAKEEKSQ